MLKQLLLAAIMSFMLTLILSAGTTFAADTCYWVGASGANWDVPGNWSGSSGGGGGDCDGGTYPNSDDTAVFDSANSVNATLNVDTVGTMTMSSGFTASVTATYAGTTTFGGFFNQSDGTFNAGSNTVDHNNLVTISGGTYDGQTATVEMFALLINNAGSIVDFSSTTSTTLVSGVGANNSLQITAGSFTAPLNGTMSLDRGLSISLGTTFNLNGADIVFIGAYNSVIYDYLGVTFNDFTVNKSGFYVQLMTDITVSGDLNLQNGPINTSNGKTLYATGTVTWGAGFDGGTTTLSLETTAPVSINGSACPNLIVNTTQAVSTTVTTTCASLDIQAASTFTPADGTTFTVTGAYAQSAGTFASTTGTTIKFDLGGTTSFLLSGGTFNAGDTSVTHDGRATINGTGTYDGQTAAMAMHSLLINAAGASVDFSNSASTTITSGVGANYNIEITAGSFTAPENGTITIDRGFYIGASTALFHLNGADMVFIGAYNSIIYDDIGVAFNNFTINKSNYVEPSTNIDLNGNLTITNGELRGGNNKTIYLGGDFTNNGTFDGQTGTINMNGTNQSILGDNSASFYNFTKIVTSPDTLYFDVGETQTFDGTLTLTGTSGNLLALKSTGYDTDTVANINPTGSVNIDYVTIEDVNNISAITPDIDLSSNAENIDLGAANTGWTFAAAYIPPAIPEFSTYMLLLTSIIGIGLIHRKFKPEVVKARG